jgi:ABC-type bacteriocin/lantibiotic exporter with double-glycine peptidase domain
MLVGAVAETLSVGAIIPFLAAIIDPAQIAEVPVAGELIRRFLEITHEPVIAASLLFLTIFLVSGVLRIGIAWLSQSVAFGISFDLTSRAFSLALRQPYEHYVEQNSSDVVAGFEKLHGITFTVLVSGIQAITSSVVAALIVGLLLVISPAIAVSSALFMVGAYVAITIFTQPVLARNSKTISYNAAHRMRQVQEALGGIRDILLDRSQPRSEAKFNAAVRSMNDAMAANAFINGVPRILMEMLVVALLCAIAILHVQKDGGIAAAVPILGAFGLGAQRLLPLLQQSYVGFSQLIGSGESLRDVERLLNLPQDTSFEMDQPPLGFSRSIRVREVAFSYRSGTAPVLAGISFEIKKGERVGIVGPSGSGKTTLMDILLGLLMPSEGSIFIDDMELSGSKRIAWQRTVAHVPQSIFLADTSIAQNIALGSDVIDTAAIQRASQKAGLHQFVASLADGYSSRVGERGVQLSGGQRQRIGVARGLYKEAQVLVLDEATSALDDRTEREVMESVASLDHSTTVFIIAHRLSTLRECSKVLRLENGRLTGIFESYDAFMEAVQDGSTVAP